MENIIEQLRQASADDMPEIFCAALQRYRELFPDWEISTISLDRAEDRNEQLDRIIAFLQNMKEK